MLKPRFMYALAGYWRQWRSGQLSLEDRNILYFTVDTAIQGLMVGGISTYLSVFVVRLEASTLLVSLLTSLPAVLMAVLSIPVGLWVERQPDPIRLTNRVRLFHRGAFLVVALMPLMLRRYLAEAVVLVWALNSVPATVINLSWMAVVAEIIPPQRRPSVNGTRWALLSIVTAGAVAVFGYLLERIDFPINYQIVFTVSFLSGLGSIYFFGLLKLPSPSQQPVVSRPTVAGQPVVRAPRTARLIGSSIAEQVRTSVRSILDSPIFARYLMATAVLRLGLNLPVALYSIYWIRHLDASDLWIGWRATASSLALIVGYYLWGRVASRRGHHLVLMVCTVGVGLYPALTALVSDQVLLPLVALVYGFFVTGIDISIFDTLLHVCPPGKRASYVALNTFSANLVISVAPMLGSLLDRWLDIRTVFYIAGSVHLVAALLFQLLHVATD
jgi:MFS family permease